MTLAACTFCGKAVPLKADAVAPCCLECEVRMLLDGYKPDAPLLADREGAA